MSPGKLFLVPSAVLLALILAVSGCGKAESHAGDTVYRLDVPDIVCQACASTLRASLGSLNGVEEVVVDVEAKTVKVGVDSALVGDDAVLREAIEGAGYKVGREADMEE